MGIFAREYKKGRGILQTISRRVFLLGGAGGMLAACSFGQAGMIPYGMVVSGEGNAVILQPAKDVGDGYLVTVQSAHGIGQATATWWGSASPHHLTFFLALAGLERFSLLWTDQGGQHGVNLSLNSLNHSAYMTVRHAAGDEVVITHASPYWMEVTASGDVSGFTVRAPQAFTDAWPPVWGISWVDFYR